MPITARLTQEQCIDVVKHSVAGMTSAFAFASIGNQATLKSLTIDTSARVQTLKTHLLAAVRQDQGGSFRDQVFMDALIIGTGSTVAEAGRSTFVAQAAALSA